MLALHDPLRPRYIGPSPPSSQVSVQRAHANLGHRVFPTSQKRRAGMLALHRLGLLLLFAEQVPGFAVLVEVVGAVGAAASCGALVAEEGES